MPTLFEKIIRGEIPSKIIYQDRSVFVIEDINPLAPVHVLIIPIVSFVDIFSLSYKAFAADSLQKEGCKDTLLHLFEVAAIMVDILGIRESGFRIVINTGKDAGQQVPHLHLHLIGGKELGGIA